MHMYNQQVAVGQTSIRISFFKIKFQVQIL